MTRAIKFLVVIGLLAALARWLADHPGSVTLAWQGWRIDTSVVVLIVAVAAVGVTAAILYRLWTALKTAPRRITRARAEGRRRRGYLALTRGMVAVAAGDAAGARRQVRRADVLLNDPPITLLMQAQTAQLAGDEAEAERLFTAMLERAETEFLGLRGLMTQAIKRGDRDAALRLAGRAHRARPDSDWVAGTLFELQTQAGAWAEARATLDESGRRRLIEPGLARRRRAVLECQIAMDAARRGEADPAARATERAYHLAPGLLPAALAEAARLVDAGRDRKAATVIEETWRRAPHPDLVPLYARARNADVPLARVRAAERLAAVNPRHAESTVALARAALDAGLWGEARRHLAELGPLPPARACRLMGEVEEREHGNLAGAREWLLRAASADPDPAWVCDSCGNVADAWSAVCPRCGAFDRVGWSVPPHVGALPSAPVRLAVTSGPAAPLSPAERAGP